MMQLTVIGGGGVRTPLFMPALARREDIIGLTDVYLVDPDERKLGLIGALCEYMAAEAGARFRLHWTTDVREALPGSDAVITTIRAGGEQARAHDERTALDHGVLGQETTGPGGFAMALRSIPAVSVYAQEMLRHCPDAWLLNFTNPAGLVTQALTEEFPTLKIAGICDTPSGLWRQVARAFGRRTGDIPIRFFGLNHLSWLSDALVDGDNVVPRILADDALLARIHQLSMFEPSLLRLVGMLPNEYLYYFYYRDRALANLRSAQESRGAQVMRLSETLLADLAAIDPAAHPQRAAECYRRYLAAREGSYMAVETGHSVIATEEDAVNGRALDHEEGEGYAGIALDILAAATDGATVVANVPNRGAIAGMADDDVVEVCCRCDADGLNPLPLGEIPAAALVLMKQVKLYERLTVAAIRTHSRDLAIQALMAHPLVGSYELSRSLANEYLDIHRLMVGDWPRDERAVGRQSE